MVMEISCAVGTQLSQKQSQKIVLTTQMRESLKILQMSLPELKQYVDRELLENPVLEYDTESEANFENCRAEILPRQESYYGKKCGLNSGGMPEEPYGPDWKEQTFTDFLLCQLSELEISSRLAKLCKFVIGSLDEKGYLTQGAQEIADDLFVSVSDADRAVKVVRGMDPAGVGARNLSDCLCLQLKRMRGCAPVLFSIAREDLELLAAHKIKLIAEKYRMPLADAQRCCDRIRMLNPLPSSGFSTSQPEAYIIPEAEVVRDCNGKLQIIRNNVYFPRMHINRVYFQMLEHPDGEETRIYIQCKINRARSFLSMMDHREKTIQSILKKIVEMQPAFFEKGNAFIRPMSMKEMAAQLNISHSTVCRAVQDKYILYGSAAIGLKSFFSGGISQTGGPAVTSASVKRKLVHLLESEDNRKPLSDQSVADLLWNMDGIEISRRTVAKYRDALGIPAASQRKTPVGKKLG